MVWTDDWPKTWFVDTDEDKHIAELQWLKAEIHRRDVNLVCREIMALERHSLAYSPAVATLAANIHLN